MNAEGTHTKLVCWSLKIPVPKVVSAHECTAWGVYQGGLPATQVVAALESSGHTVERALSFPRLT